MCVMMTEIYIIEGGQKRCLLTRGDQIYKKRDRKKERKKEERRRKEGRQQEKVNIGRNREEMKKKK